MHLWLGAKGCIFWILNLLLMEAFLVGFLSSALCKCLRVSHCFSFPFHLSVSVGIMYHDFGKAA